MAAKEYPIDEHGKEVRSEAAKWLSPDPAPEDLTRVFVGPGTTDYVYVDPASLFALERLMTMMRDEGKGKFVKSKLKGYKKFVKDVAEAAWDYWPEGGYLVRIAAVSPSAPRVGEPLPYGGEPCGDDDAGYAHSDPPPEQAALQFPEPDLVDDSEDTEEEFEDTDASSPDVDAWNASNSPV